MAARAYAVWANVLPVKRFWTGSGPVLDWFWTAFRSLPLFFVVQATCSDC